MVVNVEQLQAQVDFLEAKVKQMEDMLSLFSVNGLNDAFDGTGQQVFGGGILRLDNTGIQVLTKGQQQTALRFLQAFAPTVDNSTPYPRAELLGQTTASASYIGESALASGGGYASITDYIDGSTAYFKIDVSFDGTGNDAILKAETTTAGRKSIGLSGDCVFFPGVYTADPSFTLADGDLWYRSDTDKFRARANGVTENLATEAYVGTAAISPTIVDAKGDIIAATAADTVTRVAVGADGTVLTADSASTPGVKWSAAGGTVKTRIIINSFSGLDGTMQYQLGANVVASVAWPSANLAIYVPFVLDDSTTFVKAWWMNGATVSGNVDVGIYDESGTKKVTMGSTAQAGTNIIQEANIADTTLAAGRYYMALVLDNTTGTIFRGAVTQTPIERLKGQGMAQQATAFPLPATATFAVIGQDYVPYFGFSTRTLVV